MPLSLLTPVFRRVRSLITHGHACRAALGVCASLLLTNCADVYYYGPAGAVSGRTVYLEGYDPGDSRYAGQPTDTNSWWRGDGVPGNPHIVISLGQQQAFFYKSGKLVGVSSLSTGDVDHPTPTGKFTISQKNQWHQSSQYGDYVDYSGNVVASNIDRNVDPQPPGTKYDGANMHYFMRFTRGIGMHAGYLPGYPASHGCVRMPVDMAQAFFRNVTVGTPVEVRY
ncbi:L,D-transpeptidase-like protein [Roseimicrobium gellanilyticum]|uniref:L,D-transpeptidase-like protein n=1 Tax=Roseimicrobium gellanilyticum TaxID=748857 RepID=A0A366HQ07_9BACT|nr:L,D-transpeptidase family protein [Roseimicrobium gellanilyticum]RBP44550.1 L,D-transpeptidase-like protein [Roseimicrobium gellanilyticum]